MRGITLLAGLVCTTFSVYAGWDEGRQAFESGDYQLARGQFEILAGQGDTRAQTKLGLMYRKGYGVEVDLERAAHWYHEAAKSGDPSAQNHLGYSYEHGKGVAQSYERARFWYEQAARQGHSIAQFRLGVLYAGGHEIEYSYEESGKWLKARPRAMARRNPMSPVSPARLAQSPPPGPGVWVTLGLGFVVLALFVATQLGCLIVLTTPYHRPGCRLGNRARRTE